MNEERNALLHPAPLRDTNQSCRKRDGAGHQREHVGCLGWGSSSRTLWELRPLPCPRALGCHKAPVSPGPTVLGGHWMVLNPSEGTSQLLPQSAGRRSSPSGSTAPLFATAPGDGAFCGFLGKPQDFKTSWWSWDA